MEEKRGLFITFEGGEGTGKSTQVSMLGNFLGKEGYLVRLLREPGGTPIGEEIRNTLKYSDNNGAMASETELLLMNASRAQLVREIIRPALENREIVICDRFYDSSMAYQGYGRQLPLEDVKRIIDFAVAGTMPDITFFLVVPDKYAQENLKNRKSNIAFKKDRIEESGTAFFERVKSGYKAIAESNPNRICIPEYFHKNPEKIHQQISWHACNFIKHSQNLVLAKKENAEFISRKVS